MSRAPNFDPTRPPSPARTGGAAARQKQQVLDDFQQRLRGVVEPMLEALLLARPPNPAVFIVEHLGGGGDDISGAQNLDVLVSELTMLRQQALSAGIGSAEGVAATKVQALQRGRTGRRQAAGEKEQQQQAGAATKVQAAQRGRQARAEVAAKKEEAAEQSDAASKIQAVQRGKQGRARAEEKKAVAALTDFRPSSAAHGLARTLSEQAQTGEDSAANTLSKLRSVIRGRNRKSASIFMKMAKPEGSGEDDPGDERYSAGSAWLRQRDQEHAVEIAQRLHGEWVQLDHALPLFLFFPPFLPLKRCSPAQTKRLP